MKLLFASGNPNKHLEMKSMLPAEYELVSPEDLGLTEDIAENGDTLEANALEKADFLWNRFKIPVFADDTGLEVEALQGAPGVYSARYAGPQRNSEDNMDKLLNELSERRNRHAHFRTVIAFIDENGNSHLFEGRVDGSILRERQGKGGFGYDPIFLANGQDLSFAEMPLDAKNAISHRGRALRAFIKYLKEKRS
jgi:XTP/dITP diphosphohydrolase